MPRARKGYQSQTARKHFRSKSAAGAFARLKSTQGYNQGASRLPIRGETEWIIFWSTGILNPARSKRA